jgi:succinate-acetate transporter protein
MPGAGRAIPHQEGSNLSVSEDRTVQPSPTTAAPASGIADPAPLGLAAFALTTFLLSAKNADWMTHATGNAWLAYAFAYGGLAQLLAGMWEFRNRNVFGATAFGTYGSFWIGLFLWVRFVVDPAVAAARPATLAATVSALNHDLAWILLAFAIFNTYMLIMSAQVNLAVFGVFLTLEITEIILCIGNFNAGAALNPTTTIKIGGYVGLLTALVAWYASAAGVSNGIAGRLRFPVGRPLIS